METDQRVLVTCPCSFRFFLPAERTRAECPDCAAKLSLVNDEGAGPVGAPVLGRQIEAFECPECQGALLVGAAARDVTCDQCHASLEILTPEEAAKEALALVEPKKPRAAEKEPEPEPAGKPPDAPEAEGVPELEAWASDHRSPHGAAAPIEAGIDPELATLASAVGVLPAARRAPSRKVAAEAAGAAEAKAPLIPAVSVEEILVAAPAAGAPARPDMGDRPRRHPRHDWGL